MDEDLIPQVAAAAESSGSKDRPASWPAPKASMLKKSKMVQALRIRPGPDQPEQVLLRAEALRKAFSQAKVMRPQGELTPERYSQWQDALDTLAELQARFQLSQAFKLKAAAKKEEAQAKGSLAEMPASLNGKVLRASMQNGAPI